MDFHTRIIYIGKGLLLIFPYKWKININGLNQSFWLFKKISKGKQKHLLKPKVSEFWHLPVFPVILNIGGYKTCFQQTFSSFCIPSCCTFLYWIFDQGTHLTQTKHNLFYFLEFTLLSVFPISYKITSNQWPSWQPFLHQPIWGSLRLHQRAWLPSGQPPTFSSLDIGCGWPPRRRRAQWKKSTLLPIAHLWLYQDSW